MITSRDLFVQKWNIKFPSWKPHTIHTRDFVTKQIEHLTRLASMNVARNDEESSIVTGALQLWLDVLLSMDEDGNGFRFKKFCEEWNIVPPHEANVQSASEAAAQGIQAALGLNNLPGNAPVGAHRRLELWVKMYREIEDRFKYGG